MEFEGLGDAFDGCGSGLDDDEACVPGGGRIEHDIVKVGGDGLGEAADGDGVRSKGGERGVGREGAETGEEGWIDAGVIDVVAEGFIVEPVDEGAEAEAGAAADGGVGTADGAGTGGEPEVPAAVFGESGGESLEGFGLCVSGERKGVVGDGGGIEEEECEDAVGDTAVGHGGDGTDVFGEFGSGGGVGGAGVVIAGSGSVGIVGGGLIWEGFTFEVQDPIFEWDVAEEVEGVGASGFGNKGDEELVPSAFVDFGEVGGGNGVAGGEEEACGSGVEAEGASADGEEEEEDIECAAVADGDEEPLRGEVVELEGGGSFLLGGPVSGEVFEGLIWGEVGAFAVGGEVDAGAVAGAEEEAVGFFLSVDTATDAGVDLGAAGREFVSWGGADRVFGNGKFPGAVERTKPGEFGGLDVGKRLFDGGEILGVFLDALARGESGEVCFGIVEFEEGGAEAVGAGRGLEVGLEFEGSVFEAFAGVDDEGVNESPGAETGEGDQEDSHFDQPVAADGGGEEVRVVRWSGHQEAPREGRAMGEKRGEKAGFRT